MRKERLLIVDDDSAVLNLLVEILNSDYDCTPAASGEEALALVRAHEFDLVLSDINLGPVGGVEVVAEVAKRSPDTMIVMVSGNRDINCAIDSMRVGAFDYIKLLSGLLIAIVVTVGSGLAGLLAVQAFADPLIAVAVFSLLAGAAAAYSCITWSRLLAIEVHRELEE